MKVFTVLLIIVFSLTTNIFSQVEFTPHTITTSANGATEVYAVDVDGDGDIDVLSASEFNGKIAWYENNGNESFTSHTITTSADGAWSVYAIDVDGDGDIDVLSASPYDYKIAWYENEGNENFTSHTITTSADWAKSVYAVDVDGDGDIDVLSASVHDNKIAWYENDGNENFTAHTITTGADGAYSVYAVDVDGDGDMDVLSASYGDDIAWYENDGNENFTSHTITTSADFATEVYAVDVDGDGDMDVLSASAFDDKIAWYENDGNENFTSHTITTSADGAQSVYAIDVDGDGDIDVLSASERDFKIAWYENDGNENFASHTITTNAGLASSVYAVDVDGDGDIDVLSASRTDPNIAWYENLSPVPGDLVAYYPFNGNANDESGNGNDGVVYGASLTTDRFNNQSSAYYFNGVDNFIEVLNDPILNPTNFISISAWVAVDDVNKLSQEIISKGADHMDGHYRMHYTAKPLQNYPDHRFHGLITRIGDNYYSMLFMGDYPLQNQWYHIVMVYNGNSLIAYLNGYQEEILSVSGNLFQNDANLYIGKHMNASYPYYFSGKIDEIRIYDYALSEAEILDLYQEGGWGTNNTISVLSPNGGEVWGMGTEQFITWSSIDIIDVKIEFSSNNGASWELVNESVPSTGIYSWNVPDVHTIQGVIKISDVTDEDVFDISDGVFTIEPVTGMEDENNKLIPDKYILSQNHPNPFNPTTKIKYALPDPGLVTIRVYDVLGNEVAILVNERMEEGRYEATLDASSLSSGVYIYHMRVNDFIDTKKMILLR
jgi:hypothetical protein